MKVTAQITPTPQQGGVPLKQLRELEKELGIYLDKFRAERRLAVQQYAVYDEDGVYAGEIESRKRYFLDKHEVVEAILALTVWQRFGRHGGGAGCAD
jgi:hypothetical protein